MKALAALVAGAHAQDVVINTSYGPVKGFTSGTVQEWQSIPFAAPPTGPRRFAAPQPPTPWTDVKDATGLPWPCPQIKLDGDLLFGNEDCLYLRVYRPADIAPGEQLPVMFWIFGGGFMLGDGLEFGFYDGTNLATKHRVVIVAPNYRVDVFGFLALPELAAEDPNNSTGNMALLDQRAAMQWTKQNIQAFGGDPNNIAIFGESAGGFSVCFHLASPGSRGLFNAAIMESGSCDTPQFFREYNMAISFSRSYAAAVGCPGNGSALLDCLRSHNTEDLMRSLLDWFDPNWPWVNGTALAGGNRDNLRSAIAKANNSGNNTAVRATVARDTERRAKEDPSRLVLVDADGNPDPDNLHIQDYLAAANPLFRAMPNLGRPSWLPALAPVMPWSPVIDGVQLRGSPLWHIQSGDWAKVPWILGTNHDEANLFIPILPLAVKGSNGLDPTTQDTMNTLTQLLTPFVAKAGPGVIASVVNQSILLYPASDYKDNFWRTGALMTHYFFTCGTRRSARAAASQGVPVYLYSFERKLSFLFGLEYDLLGDYHSCEMDFVWDNEWPPVLHAFNDDDKALAAAMGEYWTNMARWRSPNDETTAIPWPLYNASADISLTLDTPLNIRTGYAGEFCDFWDTATARLGPWW